MKEERKEEVVQCSFCGKASTEVNKMVVGSEQVWVCPGVDICGDNCGETNEWTPDICNECVQLCKEILAEDE